MCKRYFLVKQTLRDDEGALYWAETPNQIHTVLQKPALTVRRLSYKEAIRLCVKARRLRRYAVDGRMTTSILPPDFPRDKYWRNDPRYTCSNYVVHLKEE